MHFYLKFFWLSLID